MASSLLGAFTAEQRKLLRRGLNPFVTYRPKAHPPLAVRFKAMSKRRKLA